MAMGVCEWLQTFLKNGPKEVSEIREKAHEMGYSKRSLREAKQVCRIAVTGKWNAERGMTDKWFWALPEDGR